MSVKSAKKLIRELGLMPPNQCTPAYLAAQFDFCQSSHSENLAGIEAVGLHGYLGYTEQKVPQPGPNTLKIAVIGKGITFDSGGISIKPSKNMHHMKFDMLGAATALALSKCVKNNTNSYLYVGCCAENMPDKYAYRPGDVITYSDGTRVEVIDTDAEGRLVLADGILFAKKWGADIIITVATLTGAARAALGEATALFSNIEHQELAWKYREKALYYGQDSWCLPIWKQHRDNIKCKHKQVADIKNCGDIAGASTAAAFLAYFVCDIPWLHLDIAGSAYKDEMPTCVALEPLKDLLEEL